MNYDIIPAYDDIFKNDKFEFRALNLTSISCALSFLGYVYTEKETCNKTLLDENLGLVGIVKSGLQNQLTNKIAITELGILRVWKSLFEKVDEDSGNHSSLLYDLNVLYRLIIKEQEFCVAKFEKKNIYNSLMTFTQLKYLDNVNNEFFRAYYMFVKNKELFSEKYSKQNFSDIYKRFEDKYKITLYEYIEALYVLIICICEAKFKTVKDSKNFNQYTFVISLKQIVNGETKEKVSKVLEMLSFNYKEANEWSINTKDNKLKFDLFQEKPLYEVTDDLYVPIIRKFMQDQIFNSLLYKINSCYDENDLSFWNALGYLFEEYVEYIFKQSIKNINCILIHQFQYGKKNKRKDSPDLIIIIKDDVFVFELKAARPLNSIFDFNNEESIQKSIDKVVKIPISQSIKITEDIVKTNAYKELTNKLNYYFVALTLGNFPDHYSDYSDLKQIIQKSLLKIKGTFNFCIEEFELLCGTIEKGDKSLTKILENYKLKPEHYSFKNYLNETKDKSFKPTFFHELENDLQGFTDRIEL